jgi:hypothetical protein
VDAGYAYFAVYAPGDEFEVGYFQNYRLPGNAYTLYVRHGAFWNADKSYAVPCGTEVYLLVTFGYGSADYRYPTQLDVTSGLVDPQTGGIGTVWYYTFTMGPTAPAEIVPEGTLLTEAQERHSAGRGHITGLTKPGWVGGCQACTIAMITAIAQNGATPAEIQSNPLQDGAAFGPVTWARISLLNSSVYRPWAVGQIVTWKPGYTTGAVVGSPPNYAIPEIRVGCVPSTAGDDRWGCGADQVFAP